MAVKSRQISIDLGHYCLYLSLKTGLETGFAFKYRKYQQLSKFWKPERREIKLRVAFLEMTINLRQVIT